MAQVVCMVLSEGLLGCLQTTIFWNESEWLRDDCTHPNSPTPTTIGVWRRRDNLGRVANRSCRGCGTIGGESFSIILYWTGRDFFKRITETNGTGIPGSVLLDPEKLARGSANPWNTPSRIGSLGWNNDDDDDDNNTTTTVFFQSTITHFYAPGGDNDWDITKHPYVVSGNKTSLGPNPDLPPVIRTFKVVAKFMVWLLTIGLGIALSALYAKTLRIDTIMASAMNCQRIKLLVRDTQLCIPWRFIFLVRDIVSVANHLVSIDIQSASRDYFFVGVNGLQSG